MAVKRFDTARLDGKGQRTPQGGLRVPARPTSAGVFLYRNADGSERWELRPPEEVFKADSLQTLAGATVTYLHPSTPVTPETYKTVSVGHVTETIQRDGLLVDAPLIVQDAEMIRKVETGEGQELSCGYSMNWDPTPGVWEGQKYDGVQRDIVYNHVAIGPVGWGRQGSKVAIRLDSGEAMQVPPPSTDKKSKAAHPMKTVRIDGIDYEIGSDAHLQAVARRDAAQQAQITEHAGMVKTLTAERDTAKARADAAEKIAKETADALKAAIDPKALQERIAARADMMGKVKLIFRVNGARWDDKTETAVATGTDDDVLVMAIKVMDPEFKTEGMTPDLIKGYFMALFKTMAKALKASGSDIGAEEEETGAQPPHDGQGASGGAPPPARTDARRNGPHGAREGTGARFDEDDTDPGAAEERMRKDSRQAWQQPLAASKDR